MDSWRIFRRGIASAVVAMLALAALANTVLAQPAARPGADLNTPGQSSVRAWIPFAGAQAGATRPLPGWPYPKVGIAIGGQVPRENALTEQLAGYWYYDWSQLCDSDSTRDRRHVPMIWSHDHLAQFTTGTAEHPLATVKSSCNDGRPLFVLNEPEMCGWGSSCDTPEQAVEVLDQVVAAGWRGPIYMSGVMVSPAAETWLKQMLDAYEQKHGTRVLQGIAGWHVHMYADVWAGHFDGRYNITVAQAPQLTSLAVWGPGYSLHTFIENRRAEGNPTALVISESGWLANTIDHLGGVPRPDAAAALLDGFAREFAATPEVKGWAWYSDYVPHHTTDPAKDPPGFCGWCFDAGNLLELPGSDQPPIPTLAGERWHQWAMQLNKAVPARFN